MSRVVLTKDERQDFFKNFIDAIDYSYAKKLLPDFLIDFFSETELDSFIKRLEVFKRLHAGHSYAKLNQDLSVSPITASKVSRALKDSGENFRQVLNELSSPVESVKEPQKQEKNSKRETYLR